MNVDSYMVNVVKGWTVAAFCFAAFLCGQTANASPRLSSITLQRTGCMGSCPVYSLTLNDSGEATYSGHQFVPRIGVYKARVDFPTFLALIAPYDPWSLEDAGPFGTDTPSLALTMVAGQQTHVVHLRMYVSMPPRFAAIVAAMDGITAYAHWEPVSMTPFAGTYVSSDGTTTLDELSIAGIGNGQFGALLTHRDSSSCDALLMPKSSQLGTLTPTRPGVAQSKAGTTIRKTTDGVILEQGGNQRWFYSVNTGAEFMLRGALEQSMIHNTLHKCG